MTDQKPTCLEITNPKIAALLIKENVAAFLVQFIGKQTTVKQAAQAVQTKLVTMAYWVNRFCELGLLQLTHIETRGGSPIKHYQSVADEFFFSTDLLEGFNNAEILERIMQRDYQKFTESVAEFGTRLTPHWRIRVFGDSSAHTVDLEPVFEDVLPQQIAPRPLHDWATIGLPAEQAAAFRQELEALFERFKKSACFDPEMPRYIMHVGFVESCKTIA